jgi:hypothetical protein
MIQDIFFKNHDVLAGNSYVDNNGTKRVSMTATLYTGCP